MGCCVVLGAGTVNYTTSTSMQLILSTVQLLAATRRLFILYFVISSVFSLHGGCEYNCFVFPFVLHLLYVCSNPRR